MKNILILSDQFTNQWLKFENPVQIIEAFSVDEVVSAIRIIDQLSKENFYLAGFISYEAAPAFDPVLHVKQQSPFPLFWFGIYEIVSNFEP